MRKIELVEHLGIQMTKIQQRTIEALRKDILLHDGLGERFVEGYEYKTFEVKASEVGEIGHKVVYLYTQVGSKTDEHTLGAIFCRTTRHIAIGPEGKCRLLNAARLNAKKEKVSIKSKKLTTGYAKVIYTMTGY